MRVLYHRRCRLEAQNGEYSREVVRDRLREHEEVGSRSR